MDKNKILAELHQRRQFFADNFTEIAVANQRKDTDWHLKNSCPSCGYLTLDSRCSWDICSICFWEDDGQDDIEADEVWGGPNANYSLTQYRIQTSAFLAELQSESLKRSAEEAIAGQVLRELQMIIDSYQPPDKALLWQQMQVAKGACFKARRFS